MIGEEAAHSKFSMFLRKIKLENVPFLPNSNMGLHSDERWRTIGIVGDQRQYSQPHNGDYGDPNDIHKRKIPSKGNKSTGMAAYSLDHRSVVLGYLFLLRHSGSAWHKDPLISKPLPSL
ncbi:MAG: hypothetical protein QXQ76_05180 [Candidatus Bathyarchaeia archaeon]